MSATQSRRSLARAVLALALGLILRPGRDGRATVIGAPGAGGGASRRLPATVVLIGAVLVMAAALTLTLSRGAIVSALNDPEVRKRFTALGFEIIANTPEQFAEFQNKEYGRWKKVIETGKITAD